MPSKLTAEVGLPAEPPSQRLHAESDQETVLVVRMATVCVGLQKTDAEEAGDEEESMAHHHKWLSNVTLFPSTIRGPISTPFFIAQVYTSFVNFSAFN